MKRIQLMSLAAVLLATSCTSNRQSDDTFALETREVDFQDRTGDVIQAEELDLEVPGVSNVVVYDSLLVFTTTDPSGMLQVYNKRTLEKIGSFCTQGSAANEFVGSAYLTNSQHYLKNGELILPLLDGSTSFYKEVNVSASLREGHTVVEGTVQRAGYDDNIVMLDGTLDRTFSFRRPSNIVGSGFTMPQYVVTEHNDTVKEIEVFKKHINCQNEDDLERCYHGMLMKHPDRNLAVFPMSFMKYILFFDLDKDEYYALRQKDTPAFPDIYVDRSWWDDNKGFGSVDCSSDMFMVTYDGGEYSINARKNDMVTFELLLFDWEGNYLGGAKMDTNVHFCSYDPDTQLLYAINIGSEKIYTYNLSGLMKSIG